MTHPDGRYFQGGYDNATGNFKGIGKYRHSNGDVYVGQFENTHKNGLGKYWNNAEQKWTYGIWNNNGIGLNPVTLEAAADPANAAERELDKAAFKTEKAA